MKPAPYNDAATSNLRKMGTSQDGNLFISEVLYKTFISTDERGTRVGVATSVAVEPQSGLVATIWLNRLFIFAIIDDTTNLPIFIGTVLLTTPGLL